MRHVPLLLIPFLLYNAFAFVIFEDYEGDFREAALFGLPLPSGAAFQLTVSATIIIMALFLLGFEVVKATRIASGAVSDHVLATAVFVVFLLEFLLIRQAATATFVILLAIALVDLVCGFAVSIRSATRDVSIE